MRDPSLHEAAQLLESAREAKTRGATAVRHPSWYPIGLGLCTAMALAGFAVPGMETTGIVLGAIILPLTLEHAVRRQTGGTPLRSYLEPPFRTTTLVAVFSGGAIAGASLLALKATGESWIALPGALIIGIGTTLTARRIERLRVRTSQRPEQS